MKGFLPLLWLFVILITLIILLFFIPEFLNKGIPFRQSAILVSGSFIISALVMMIFRRGYNLGGNSMLSYTLAAISLKFILYFFMIIGVFFLLKNRSLEFIITFFVIYLSFTSYVLFSFVNLLRKKTLKSK